MLRPPPNAEGEPRPKAEASTSGSWRASAHPLVGRAGTPVPKAPEAWPPPWALPSPGGHCGIGREPGGPASSSVGVYRLAWARGLGYAALPSPNATTESPGRGCVLSSPTSWCTRMTTVIATPYLSIRKPGNDHQRVIDRGAPCGRHDFLRRLRSCPTAHTSAAGPTETALRG